MRFSQLPFRVLGSMLCLLLGSTAAIAQDFRVETSVYPASSSQAISKGLTLFSEGRVYDFSLTANETTVFDPDGARFVLLDTERRLRTEVNLEWLGKYVAVLRQEGLNSKAAKLFAPEFDVDDARDSSNLTLTSDAIKYRAEGTVPPESHASAVGKYRQFTDWSARLNTTHKFFIPPFGRLILNDHLHVRNLIPEHVEFVYSPEGREKAVYRSRQAFAWFLTDDDRQRIEAAERQIIEFTPVELQQYRENRP